MTNDSLVSRFADFVYKTSFSDFDDKTIINAKKVLLDSFGNIIYTRYSKGNEQILNYARLVQNTKKEGNVSVIGMLPNTFKVRDAVFLHSIMARYSDLDDGYSRAMGHPASSIVPLALSLSELYSCSGKELIASVIVAYDIYYRLGIALNPYMYRKKGLDATGICGTVACAAIAARMGGCNKNEIKNSMGLAALNVGGLTEYQNDGSSGKLFCGGWGAIGAIQAVTLAKHGFTGPEKIFEGKRGLFQAFSYATFEDNIYSLASSLGTEYKISDVYFKRYACMRGLHATLDGILHLAGEHSIAFDTIVAVNVETSSFVGRLSNPSPNTVVAAQNSLEFCIAVLLKYGNIASKEILSSSLNDSVICQFAKYCVNISVTPEINAYIDEFPSHFGAASITLITQTNQKYSLFSPYAEGDSESPFDWNVLSSKFYSMCQGTPIKGDYTLHSVSNIENKRKVSIDDIFKLDKEAAL